MSRVVCGRLDCCVESAGHEEAPQGDKGHPLPSAHESDCVRGLLPAASEQSTSTSETSATLQHVSSREGTVSCTEERARPTHTDETSC